MKISLYDVSKNPTKSVSFERNVEISELGALRSVGIVDVKNVFVSGELLDLDSQFVLKMDLTLEMTLVCSRCLKEFVVEEEYHIDSMISQDDDDIDGIIAEDGEVDIAKVVVDEILASKSMKSLCSIDCQGICSGCGADLNVEECECEEDEIDPRLEGLLDLLK